MIATRGQVIGIAGGLLLMSLFTLSWAVTAASGLHGISKSVALTFFGPLSLLFLANSIHLTLVSRKISKSVEMGKAVPERVGIMFSLVFVIEVIAILITVRLLANSNHSNFVIPAIALIVGLHFIPMAKIFRNNFHYYIAAWTCTIALIGIILAAHSYSKDTVSLLVGVGSCMATSAYGIYFLRIKRILLA